MTSPIKEKSFAELFLDEMVALPLVWGQINVEM